MSVEDCAYGTGASAKGGDSSQTRQYPQWTLRDCQFAWPLLAVPTHSCAKSDKRLSVDLSAGFKKITWGKEYFLAATAV